MSKKKYKVKKGGKGVEEVKPWDYPSYNNEVPVYEKDLVVIERRIERDKKLEEQITAYYNALLKNIKYPIIQDEIIVEVEADFLEPQPTGEPIIFNYEMLEED